MGYLHKGHISLVRESKKLSDVIFVSIFVNPAQFSPNEDLTKYPRDFEADQKLLENEEVDYLFYPTSEEIYPQNFQTYVEVKEITKILEGEFRPTHFAGVTTIVSMLFNIIQPDFAFFGQKDAQQVAVIKQVVKDLKYAIKIIVCPIMREPDGLAMSSRNVYLDVNEREDALVLYRALLLAEQLIKNGLRNSEKIKLKMLDIINSVDSSHLDYIEIVEEENFVPMKELKTNDTYLILIACKIGKTRLIDNIIVIETGPGQKIRISN